MSTVDPRGGPSTTGACNVATARNATTNGANDSAEALLRNPITGIAGLLRARRERPRRRAADQRDELATPDHSITSSASASSVAGTSRPRVLAVLRLMTSS